MNRRLGVTAVAVVLALIGTALVFAYVNKADARAVAGLHPTEAYVAARTIPRGTQLGDAVQSGLARKESLPKKTVPVGAVTAVTSALRGQVAMADIPAGQILFTAAFGSQRAQQGALHLPTGTMAVSLALEDPQHVGGFVQPGSKVAIFDTFNTVAGFGPQGGGVGGQGNAVAGDGLATNHDYNHSTRLLLASVPVLAIGSGTQPQPAASAAPAKTGAAGSSSTQTLLLTVAVSQGDAEKLIQGIQTGHLYLGLLGADSQVAPSKGVDDTNLFQ